MHRLVHALIGTLPLAACHAAGQVRSSPPPSIVAALAPMMIETGVRVACLADTLGVPAGTVPIDLLLTSDSGASSSVVRVVFTRTPPSNQQPVLTFELGEIGQSRRVGESCGSRGATLRASAARFSALELDFATWAPIRITVRDPEWRPLTTRTFTESTPRAFELTWR